MTKLGEIRKAKELFPHRDYAKYQGNNLYIWHACVDCGKERWVKFEGNTPKSPRCNSCSRLGERSGKSWKGGVYTDTKKGYVWVKLYPDDFFFPMTRKNGYVLEHRLVMAKKLGRCLHPWEPVHHKGIRYTGIENKGDNLEDNLELSCGISEHSLNHSKGYRHGYAEGLRDAGDKVKKAERERIINKLYDYFGTRQMGMPHGRTTLARSKAKELILGLILEDTGQALKGETNDKPTD